MVRYTLTHKSKILGTSATMCIMDEFETINNIPMNIPIKLLTDTARMPSFGSSGAACFDIYSDSPSTIISPGETVIIKTGLSAEIPLGLAMKIYSRSGYAFNGLIVGNAPGVIDSDFRGEIGVILHNHSRTPHEVIRGQRVAQGEITEVLQVSFDNVLFLSETERGQGGFGSTGK